MITRREPLLWLQLMAVAVIPLSSSCSGFCLQDLRWVQHPL